jgi:hypothetical protein
MRRDVVAHVDRLKMFTDTAVPFWARRVRSELLAGNDPRSVPKKRDGGTADDRALRDLRYVFRSADRSDSAGITYCTRQGREVRKPLRFR